MPNDSRRRLADVSSGTKRSDGGPAPARLPAGSADAAAYARGVLRVEASAIEQLCARIDGAFSEAGGRIFSPDRPGGGARKGEARLIPPQIRSPLASPRK